MAVSRNNTFWKCCEKFTNIFSDRAYAGLIVITIAVTMAYSAYSILKYYSLAASGWDLGIHSQVLWSTMNGNLFYSPLIGENLLAEHFAPFEFIQLPIYFLYSSPASLLVFQAIFVAFATLPLYLISKTILVGKINSKKILASISLGFSISYLFSPYTLSLISFDFHNISFLPFFLFLAFYGFLTERKYLSIFSIIMIVSLHSNFIYIAATLLLYELFYLRTGEGKKISEWLIPKIDARSWKNNVLFIFIIVLLYGYLVFAGFLKGYFVGTPVLTTSAITGASGTPFTSVPSLIHLLFTNPKILLQYFSANSYDKEIFFLILLGSLIFLPLFSPLSLILSIPFALYALPSNYAGYYGLGYQYTGMIVGAMYISAIIGLYNLFHIFEKCVVGKKLNIKSNVHSSGVYGVLVALLVATILIIPFGVFSPPQVIDRPGNSQIVDVFDLHYSSEAINFLKEGSNHIPSNSYILTQNNLMPFFSNYVHAYSTPWSPGISSNIDNFQYIVIQNGSFWAEQPSSAGSLQTIATNYLANGTFTIFESDRSLNLYILVRTN